MTVENILDSLACFLFLLVYWQSGSETKASLVALFITVINTLFQRHRSGLLHRTYLILCAEVMLLGLDLAGEYYVPRFWKIAMFNAVLASAWLFAYLVLNMNPIGFLLGDKIQISSSSSSKINLAAPIIFFVLGTVSVALGLSLEEAEFDRYWVRLVLVLTASQVFALVLYLYLKGELKGD